MNPYRHEDRDSDWLTVAEHAHATGVALVRACKKGVEVTPEDIPEITAALWEACGQESPTVLNKLNVGPSGANTALGMIYPFKSTEGPRVGVNGDQVRYLKPAEATYAGTVLAACARLAEPEGSARVEELAKAIHKANCTCGDNCVQDAPDADYRAARAALRWMDDQKAAAS